MKQPTQKFVWAAVVTTAALRLAVPVPALPNGTRSPTSFLDPA